MKTQWPVSSAPFPLGQMQIPIITSPSTHGGGGGSAEEAGARGASGTEATGESAAEADAEPAADAIGETDVDGASTDAGFSTGRAGTTGAEAQAGKNPAPERARAIKETTR